ncbi:MAG: alpha/beta hydrolase [Pirellulales bacterium]|nr:alpha/beta hydrolase [Pirellulales bacterium]
MPDPKLAAVIRMLRSRPIPPHPDLAFFRANFDQMMSEVRHNKLIAHEAALLGGVAGEWIGSDNTIPGRILLYLHGGAYVIGSVAGYRELVLRLATACAARAFAVDYRLAPEHPFPAAVDDAVAAYRGLLESGVEPRRIAIAGDSAGGGLTLATLVALRDSGISLPGAGVLLSPWVDLECRGESMTTRGAVDPMILRDPLLQMASMYLAGADPRTPLASPLYADLAGLPPLLIQVGTCEMLFDDSTRIAARAEKAGLDVRCTIYEEMIHVWHLFPLLDGTRRAIAEIGQFVNDRL